MKPSQHEDMLERVRRALGRSANQPVSVPSYADLPRVVPIPSSRAVLVDHFEQELREIGGYPHRAENPQQLQEVLQSILKTTPESNVVLTRNPLIGNLRIISMLQEQGVKVTAWQGKNDGPGVEDFQRASFEAQVGVTGVDYVLAETGSLVVSSRTEGTQLASLAPPVHIALYRPEQVAAGIEEIIDWLGSQGSEASPAPGRSVVFITGPSRTGDIELTITVGVHGPQEVHAILIGDGCLSDKTSPSK